LPETSNGSPEGEAGMADDSHQGFIIEENATDNAFANAWPAVFERRARRIVRILATVHVAVAIGSLALWAKAGHLSLGETVFGEILISQSFSLALWTAWGGKRTFLRMVLTAVGMVAVMHIGCRIPEFRGFFHFWMPLTIATCTIFLVLRFLGLELKRLTDPETPRWIFQFSLFQMMALTLTVAICLSALKCMPENSYHFYPEEVFMMGVSLWVGLVSVGLVFLRRWLPLRILAFPATVILAEVLFEWRFDGQVPKLYAFYFFTIMMIATMISLAVVRWAGYRMTWRWRFRLVGQPRIGKFP
jgi:hypothetical protein